MSTISKKKFARGKTSPAAVVVPAQKAASAAAPAWTFLSNHAHVLLCLAENSSIRLREVATLVGITERMVQKVVADLAAAGYVEVQKDGRRNTYTVHAQLPLRHPLEAHRTIGQILDLVRRR